MYETLLTFAGNDLTKPVGGLASSYELSPDAHDADPAARAGRVFSDGSPVTADDVVFSLQPPDRHEGQPVVPARRRHRRQEGRQHRGADQREAERRRCPFILPNPALAIVNSKVVKANGGTTDDEGRGREVPQRRPPPGSGPYVLKSLDVASQAVLTKNPKYNGPDKPAYDNVVIRNVKARHPGAQRPEGRLARSRSTSPATRCRGWTRARSRSPAGASAYTIFLLLNQGADGLARHQQRRSTSRP